MAVTIDGAGTITGLDADGISAPQINASIPQGSVMLFVQTTAPVGFTKSTAHDNKSLRVVSGTAGSGGSVAFTTAFASKSVTGTVANHTLSIAEIATHSHGLGAIATTTITSGTEYSAASGTNFPAGASTYTTGSSSPHNHGFTGTAIDLAVQYVDTIICTKN